MANLKDFQKAEELLNEVSKMLFVMVYKKGGYVKRSE